MNEEKENEKMVQDGEQSPENPESGIAPVKHQQAVEHGLTSINLFDPAQLAAAENFLTKIMRSEKGGIKSVNDGLAVLMRAKDLNLPFSTSLEHIHVINGKTGIDIHIIKALLSKAGTITWKCTKNYSPVYEYTDGSSAYAENKLPENTVACPNKAWAEKLASEDTKMEHMYVWPVKFYQDMNGNMYKDYALNMKQFAIAANKQQAAAIQQSGRVPVFRIANQPVDYIVEYEFTRYREIFGKVVEVKAVSSFSYVEAVAAGCFEKDTYKKYPKVMIAHRAFVYGARDIASDLLLGCMEITELKQVNNIDITDADVIEIG